MPVFGCGSHPPYREMWTRTRVGDAALLRSGWPEPHFTFTSMVWMRRKKEFILENAREEGNSQGTGSLSYGRDREEAVRASNIPADGWGARTHASLNLL